MKYIDVKETTWRRYILKDDVDVNKLIDHTIECGEEFILNNYESEHCFEILGLSSFLSPEENDGYSTFEIYENDEKVYDNSIVK